MTKKPPLCRSHNYTHAGSFDMRPQKHVQLGCRKMTDAEQIAESLTELRKIIVVIEVANRFLFPGHILIKYYAAGVHDHSSTSIGLVLNVSIIGVKVD